jgi:hypothetical protein
MTALMGLGDMADAIRPSSEASDVRETARRIVGRIEVEQRNNVRTWAGGTAAQDVLPNDRKAVLRSALYVLAMLRHEDDLDLLVSIAGGRWFDEPTTPAMAQWGADRINIRRLAEAQVRRSRTNVLEQAVAHQLSAFAPSGSLRRLVSPLLSLQYVKDQASDVPRSLSPGLGRRPKTQR